MVSYAFSCQSSKSSNQEPAPKPHTPGKINQPNRPNKPAPARPAEKPASETSKPAENGSSLINVKDQGAKGNGRADDTKALQQIFRQAKPGATIYFPDGEYLLGEDILLAKDGLTLKGNGEKSIIRFNNANDLYGKYTKRTGMFNVYADNITIQNLTFDQNFRASGRKDGDSALAGCILIGGAYTGKSKVTNNMTIENCLFYDIYGDGISAFNTRSINAVVRNNHFITTLIVQKWKTAGTKGEQCISFNSVEGAVIENNTIEGSLDDAIAIHAKSKDVVVKNNTISTAGGRILMNGTQHGQIIGNTIRYIDNGPSAIMVSFSNQAAQLSLNDGVTVTNNKIYIEKGVRVQQAIRLFGAGDNITVSDNTIEFEGEKSVGIEMEDRNYAKEKRRVSGKNIAIRNNTVKNGSVGIQETIVKTDYGENVTLQDNTIVNCEVGVNANKKYVRKNKYVNVKDSTQTIPLRQRAVQPRKAADNEDEDN